jgi:hypothetical protein
MSRDTASRDVKLNALAVLTGGITAATFVGTGLVTGLAADYTSQKAQARTESKAAALPVLPAPQPTEAPLPVRTVVTTRIVQRAAAPAAPVGASRTRPRSGTSSHSASGSAPAAPVPVARAAAPAAARAPRPGRAPAPARKPAAPPAPSAAS